MPPASIVLALGHRFASLDPERGALAGVAEVVDGNSLDAAQRRGALSNTSGPCAHACRGALASCRFNRV